MYTCMEEILGMAKSMEKGLGGKEKVEMRSEVVKEEVSRSRREGEER